MNTIPGGDTNRDQPRVDQRSILHRLRETVWQIEDADNAQDVLVAVRKGLELLKIPFKSCGVYLVDPSSAPLAVLFHDMSSDGEWQPTKAEEGRDTVVQIWKARIPAYRQDLDQEGKFQEKTWLARRLGYPVYFVLDVPFSHGLLVVNSSEPVGFSPEDTRFLMELGEVLSVLFRRLEDLRELEAREQQIRQAQGLAMVGQLAAGAAHEINNALTAVLGQSELLLRDRLEPSVREGVEMVYQAACHVQTISGSLLGLARGQTQDKELLDLNLLVQDMVRLTRRQFEKENIQLVEDLKDGLPRIEGHAGQIQQIVLNLIQNSRDAILESKIQGTVQIRTCEGGGRVGLEVRDDGPGIPSAIAGRIFEPFFTTKKAGKGTGLGLSVCQEIAKKYRGQLRIEPREEGACIVLELPAAEG